MSSDVAAMSGDYSDRESDSRSLLRSNLDSGEKDIESADRPVAGYSDEGEPSLPLIRPAVHEMGIKFLLAEDPYGLTPYYAVVREWEPDLDETVAPFIVEFPTKRGLWEITKGGYWNGCILVDGEQYDTYNEYTIQVRARSRTMAQASARFLSSSDLRFQRRAISRTARERVSGHSRLNSRMDCVSSVTARTSSVRRCSRSSGHCFERWASSLRTQATSTSTSGAASTRSRSTFASSEISVRSVSFPWTVCWTASPISATH